MGTVIRRVLVIALLAALPVFAEERLAVYEFFGRPGGQYCRDAAPSVLALQQEYRGRALLLEYDYDQFPSGRVDRWWAARSGVGTVYLPLVMVGSGFRTSYGPADYYSVYKSMLNAELARPPEARVEAWSRRQGNTLKVYVRVENRSTAALTAANSAAIWLLVWEDVRRGLTDTWVRAVGTHYLTATLGPGASTTAVLTTPTLSGVDWNHLRSLALLEHRPGGTGRYDMLQAAVAAPAGVTVSPSQIELTPVVRSGTVTLAGPHVLSWSATTDAPWLALEPASGTFPATLTVSLTGERPAPGATADVHVTASGDGMSFSASFAVETAVESPRLRTRLMRQEASPPSGDSGVLQP